jgi:hypothetical protein
MLFKRPMWLASMGKHRDKISLIDYYHNYSARYDIEHLFRFGKQKLLLNSYQTPDVEHEENWWRLSFLAYVQLYLGRELAPLLPEAWECYLPEYKNPETGGRVVTTASQTQRGFDRILEQVGTPAESCVARGNPRGRIQGENASKRDRHPVIFKHSKSPKQSTETILSGSESTTDLPNPQKFDSLVKTVKTRLKTLQRTTESFITKLTDSG